MVSIKDLAGLPVANYDPDRKGIFIHKNELNDSSFKVGDRFSVKVGKQDLFAISIVKDDKGDIVFDICWAAFLMNMFFISNPIHRDP
jgi:hypothetical protein